MWPMMFLGSIVLSGCTSSPSVSGPRYTCANEPDELSDGEIQKLKMQAGKSDVRAAYRLYTYYLFSENGMPEAMHWLRVAAEEGYPLAEYNLGALLRESDSSQDKKEARLWLAKAAKDGVTTPTK
jgi:TPR repeat protein